MNNIIFSRTIPGVFAEESIIENEFSMSQRHFHSTIEFYFMLEGCRYHFVEQNLYHLKPGMALLINSNKMHKTSVSNDSNGHRRFLLQLDASTLDKYFSLPDFPSIHDFGENFCGVVEFTPKDWQQVLSIIQLLKEEMNPTASGKNIIPLLLVAQLAALFIRNRKHQKQLPDNHSRAANTAHSNIYQTVQEIILYLENNSHESHSLDDISDKFYISRAYLTRVFKSFTGFTVTEYIAFCRIRKAKVLLSETNLSITDIATQVGFGNVTYFERIFKRMTDYTPLQYRKQSR